MKFTVLLGRILFSLIFIKASFGHFSPETIQHVGSRVPLANLLVPLSGVLALLGGLSVALGFKARWGGVLLVMFLIPVTLMMHNFWAAAPKEQMMQQTMFMKNISMLGGALLIAHFGAGPWSIDNLLRKKPLAG